MAVKNLTLTGSALLTGSIALRSATEITAPTSSLSGSSTATLLRIVPVLAGSTAAASSSGTPARLVDAEGASAAGAYGSATVAGVFVLTGASRIRAESSARYDGEGRETWVTNLQNSAVSRYVGFDFNSFAAIGDRLFGFNEHGIFEITGSTDDGEAIDFFMMTGPTRKDEGIITPYQAYVVGLIPSEDMTPVETELFVITDKDVRYSYDVASTETRLDTTRVALGKGLRCRHLRYGLFGSTKAPLELSSITLLTAESGRNI